LGIAESNLGIARAGARNAAGRRGVSSINILYFNQLEP
jgi:hypothetical protein